jgi:HlyD family secretion protein
MEKSWESQKEFRVRNKIIFILSIVGIIAGLMSAYIYGMQKKPQQPVFNPASNPYTKGVYSVGIIESYQTHGENINIYPEVSGTVKKILIAEGQIVHEGTPLLLIDDSVQQATVEQQKSQAEAALALLEELKAQPRKENLEIAKAQVEYASANLKSAQDQLDKQRKSYALNPKSVSKDALDNAENAFKVAKANLEVVQRQFDLTKAGAWIYDIKNQEKQYNALSKAFTASNALLAKYIIKAPTDGVVLSVNAAAGSYISSQGTYDTYTQGMNPVVVMGSSGNYMGVRCYIDEILLHRLPQGPHMKAQMFIRGTSINIPLEFVRVQPYVSPKIELSNQRTERVDVRVLPTIFRFEKPKDINLYPGQLVDVYIGEK